jgi:beta-lactamase regulating signal transducer with metallopeptidase domain
LSTTMRFITSNYPAYDVPSLFLLTLLVASVKGSLAVAILYLVSKTSNRKFPGFRHSLWLFGIYGFPFFFLVSILLPKIHFETPWLPYDGRWWWRALGTLTCPNAVSREPASALSAAVDAFSNGGAGAARRVFGWHAAVFLVWISGVLISFSKVILGEVGLFRLVRRASVLRTKKYGKVLDRLARGIGVKEKVTLLRSERCTVPFTFLLLHPVIVLPFDVGEWPAERAEAVLAHEICHVKRKDLLTQLVARTVCSFFWFIPIIWLGYRSLCLEQESACDGMVVAAGIEQTAYARCFLDFARVVARRSSFAGLHFASWCRRTLERRIRSILDAKPFERAAEAVLSGGVPNRLRRALAVLASACFLIGAISEKVELAAPPVPGKKTSPVSRRNFYVPGPREELYGTWLNQDYSGIVGGNCQKVVFDDWGYAYDYRSVADPDSLNRWTSTIVDKWEDSAGDVWYREFEQCPGFYSLLQLVRISGGGKTLEWVFDYHDFPEQTDMNSLNITYRVYHRER